MDITGYLAQSAGLAVGLGNGAHLVTGTGTAQPQGIANAGVAGVTGAVGTTVKFDLNTPPGADGLIDLYHSLNSGYRANGEWIMNDLTAAYIRKLKDSTGQYVWQSGMSAGQPDRLFGRPVLLDPNMAAMGANALSVGFGDFNLYYIIRDVGEVRFERSDDFAFGNDLVSFRVIFRTDAKQLINDSTNSAVKFFKHSAT